jgi:hypothetical protein
MGNVQKISQFTTSKLFVHNERISWTITENSKEAGQLNYCTTTELAVEPRSLSLMNEVGRALAIPHRQQDWKVCTS